MIDENGPNPFLDADDPEITPHFEQIDPPGRLAGVCWLATLHAPDDCPPFPLALAWVSAWLNAPPGFGPLLDYVLVPDHLRRRGYAARLIRACHERWPSLMLSDAISPEGEALIASLQARRKTQGD